MMFSVRIFFRCSHKVSEIYLISLLLMQLLFLVYYYWVYINTSIKYYWVFNLICYFYKNAITCVLFAEISRLYSEKFISYDVGLLQVVCSLDNHLRYCRLLQWFRKKPLLSSIIITIAFHSGLIPSLCLL